MPYYILTINYPALIESSDDRVCFPDFELIDEFEPVEILPWLDPCWGIVHSRIEAVDSHYPAVQDAEIVVEADPDFLPNWNFNGPNVTVRYPREEIFLSWDSKVYHVSHKKVSHLSGTFASEAYCALIGSRIPEIEVELLERARQYVERKLDLLSGLDQLDPGIVLTAIDRSMWALDLLEADYGDLDTCAQEATRALRTEITELEIS